MNKWMKIAGLLLFTFPVVAHAEDYTCTTNNGEITITGYTGTNGVLSIPSIINGRTVTGIGTNAFDYCTGLTSVTIPGSVTNIGSYAFASCTSLTNIVIPSGVVKIGSFVFNRCYSLPHITIPSSVTSIGNSPAASCTNLSAITVDELNNFYISMDGVLFNRGQTLLIQYPAGKPENGYTIPSSVTNIGGYAFSLCTSLINITISDHATSIGLYAFDSCTSLTNVVIGNSVSNIGTYAFDNCLNLTKCNIPASVATIGDYVFWLCTGLTAITVDTNNSVYSSVNGILFNKNQTVLKIYPAGKAGLYYTIPNSVTNVGNGAFAHCNINGVAIPNSVTTFGYRAFHYCLSLTNIMFSANVASIGDEAIRGCDNLAAVTVDTNNIFYSSLDGALFNKSQTSLIQYPAGNTSTSYTVAAIY